MARKKPQPKQVKTFYGHGVPSHLGETWLEAEEYAYPAGSLRRSGRKALVRDSRGRLVVATVGIPSSYSTIPAKTSRGHGTLYVEEQSGFSGGPEYTFRSYKSAQKKMKAKSRVGSAREQIRRRLIDYLVREGMPYEEAASGSYGLEMGGFGYGIPSRKVIAELRAKARKHMKSKARHSR